MLLPTVAAQVCTPTNRVLGPPSSTPCQHVSIDSLTVAILTGVRWYIAEGSDVEPLFTSSGHLCAGEVCVQIVCPFSIGLFFGVSCVCFINCGY